MRSGDTITLPPLVAVVKPWADPSPTPVQRARELDRSNSTQLGRDVLDVLDRGFPTIVLDCRGTGFISSYGLATIVRLSKLVRDHGRRFVVIGLCDDLVALFATVKMDQIVETMPILAAQTEGLVS